MKAKRRLALGLAATAAFATACGGSGVSSFSGIAGSAVKPVASPRPPQTVLGLRVLPEEVTDSLKQLKNTYVEALSVYSFRQQSQLQATLQICRLAPQASSGEASFRSGIINNLGGAAPTALHVGDSTVFVTVGTGQQLSLWFRDKYFFVLAIREAYPQKRTLLRELLKVQA